MEPQYASAMHTAIHSAREQKSLLLPFLLCHAWLFLACWPAGGLPACAGLLALLACLLCLVADSAPCFLTSLLTGNLDLASEDKLKRHPSLLRLQRWPCTPLCRASTWLRRLPATLVDSERSFRTPSSVLVLSSIRYLAPGHGSERTRRMLQTLPQLAAVPPFLDSCH